MKDDWLAPPRKGRPRRLALPFPGGAGSSRLRPHPARDRPATRHVDRRPPPACADSPSSEPRRRLRRRLHGLGELDLRRGVRGPVPAARPRRPRLGRAGGPHPDPPGDLPAPERPVPRGLARPLGQQPREPRRRGLAAREPSPGPSPLHHLQPGRRPRHVLPGPPRRPDDRPRREDERPQPRDDQQLHEHGPRRSRPGRPSPGLRGACSRARAGRRRPAAGTGGRSRRDRAERLLLRSSTSAAAAASAPPARPRSRCWR